MLDILSISHTPCSFWSLCSDSMASMCARLTCAALLATPLVMSNSIPKQSNSWHCVIVAPIGSSSSSRVIFLMLFTIDRRKPCLSSLVYHVVERSCSLAGTMYKSLQIENVTACDLLLLVVLIMLGIVDNGDRWQSSIYERNERDCEIVRLWYYWRYLLADACR